jgi:hypothetical protein
MRILLGRYAGQTATLHQFANDWMAVDIPGVRRGVIVKPTQVRLDDEEYARVASTRNNLNVGSFWREWQLNDDGTFTPLKH